MTTAYDPYGAAKIRALLASGRLHLSKERGQNYLVSRASAEKIVNALPPLTQGQVYFEVGSGLGALTLLLAEMGPTLSLEIDKGVHRVLGELFSHPNLRLLHGDFLKETYPKDTPYLFISNLPYSISGEALKVFIEEPCFSQGVVMLQKEFAERLAARESTPAYGPLSVIAQNFLELEKLFFVGKGNFFPVPQVDSLVVRLRKKDTALPQKEFGVFVKTLFAAKRKTLANNAARSPWPSLAEDTRASLRPDALSPQEWKDLFLKRTFP